MLEDKLVEDLEKAGRKWRIEGELRKPTTTDVRQVLDWAAGELYTHDIGARLETGGLIIEKTTQGFDVFVIAGFYY